MTDQGSSSGLGSADVAGMMEQLAQQKAQAGKTGGSGASSAGLPSLPGMSVAAGAGSGSHAGAQPGSSAGQPTKNPRGFTGPVQELKNFGNDALDAATSFMPPFMQNLFRPTLHDTPEQAQKKKQMLSKYQQLTAEQQQYAQARLKERQQKEQQELQEKQAKKQREEQEKQSQIAMPQGKTRGAEGGNSNRKRTTQKLQDDRTKQGSAGAG